MAVWDHIEDYGGPPIHHLLDEQSLPELYVDDNPVGYLDEFFAIRDPDGSLRSELESLGAFNDQRIDIGEFTELLHKRLLAAGHTSTLTWLNSASHSLDSTSSAAAQEAIAALLFESPAD